MLPSLTVAFIAGLLVGSQIPYFPLVTSFLLLLVGLGAVALEQLNRVSVPKVTWHYGIFLVGVVYWLVVVNLTAHGPIAEDPSDATIEVTGRIVAPVQQAPDRLVMIIRSDNPVDASAPSRHVRLTWRTPERVFFQGDRVGFRAIVRRPSGSLNPGGFSYGAYLERQGIDAIATVTGLNAVQFLESGYAHAWWAVWTLFDQWRGNIRLAAVQTLSQPALGLYMGIIIGDRGYLDPELRDQFMTTGTVHLLSISGSHLGLVALLIFSLVRWATILLPSDWLLAMSRKITPTRIAAVCTLLPVAGYACLAGAELATIRSLLMVTVGLSAIWLGQERRLFHALSVAAMVILLHDPQALFDISFQLSFLSVIAMAGWLSRQTVVDQEGLLNESSEPSYVRTCIRWGRDSIVMSGVVTLVTLPLVAYYFYQLPWLGLFTNVVAVPVMGILLVPIGLVSAVWEIAIGGAVLPLATMNQWLLEYFVMVIRLISMVSGGEWHIAAPSVFTMVLFYACLSLLWQRVVTRLTCGNHTMLFAADVEDNGLLRMSRSPFHSPVEVLKVPHHGAVSSLNYAWLASLHPQYAVFSAGRHNSYRHPAEAVLDAYKSEGSTVLRTDHDGGVWFTGRASGDTLHVHRTSELMLQPTNSVSCLLPCEKANWIRIWKQWRDGH